MHVRHKIANLEGGRYILTELQLKLLTEARMLLNANITYRELECGRFLMIGCSVSVIAEILEISQRTVECYLRSLRLKCGCKDKWRLAGYLRQCFGVTVSCTKLDLATLDKESTIGCPKKRRVTSKNGARKRAIRKRQTQKTQTGRQTRSKHAVIMPRETQETQEAQETRVEQPLLSS